MDRHRLTTCLIAVLIACVGSPMAAAEPRHHDHDEFDASLDASFRAENGQWPIVLNFDYPAADRTTRAAWVLEVLSPDRDVVRQEKGLTPLSEGQARIATRWDGRGQGGRKLPAGYYTVRLRAAPVASTPQADGVDEQRIDAALAASSGTQVEQSYDVLVGTVRRAALPRFRPMKVGARALESRRPAGDSNGIRLTSAPAGNGLPYTVYYGNLHSQTNHSDGGTSVEHCEESENPQAGELGPTEAYEMMRTEAEGDFLLTSEHNHLYDGSTRRNASAKPSTAIALFRSGVKAASDYRTAHPTFMALYGLEWGVISDGGHINLINANVLANWERNDSGQLIGSVETPKSDYPALYEAMKERGWIGQFNHPDPDQFKVDGEGLGFDENGADVMVLAEVLNTSAFSTNTSQTETRRRGFVGSWNRLLERGYKLAPASNQDNHCANWGLSFTNRTGVLLAENAALTKTNFLNALRARRVFATEDKTGQLVLTANGHVMGKSFTNRGKLTLKANYASTDGHTAQRVQFFEGVPGRNREVTRLAGTKGTLTITPEVGEHFYYAVVTQEDGLRLWSAPVWVTQE
jgi:hypothetical protein